MIWINKDSSYSSSSKLSYCHQITAPNGWGHFRCQVQVQNTFWVVYPFAKEVSPKINELQVITFDDASANADYKFVAPPKPHFFEIDPGNFRKNFIKNFFWRRKMKSCKSSETRFPKVSRRSELCSTGKPPFEVSEKNWNSRIHHQIQ